MLYASTDQPAPPGGEVAEHRRQRPAVRVALHVPGRRTAVLLLRGDGRARRTRRSRSTSPPRTSSTRGGSRSSAASSTPSPATRTTRGSRRPSPAVYTGQCAELCGRNHANMSPACAPSRRPSTSAGIDREGRRHRRPRNDAGRRAARAARARRQARIPVASPRTVMAASRRAIRDRPRPEIVAHEVAARAQRAGPSGSPRPITSGSGSSTSSRRSSSSCSAASRRC